MENYFSLSELTKTDTGLPNTPVSPNHLGNLANLWNYLNSLREALGQPIFINSAYRTPIVNQQIGGAERSLHMQGCAADIRTLPLYMPDLWRLIQEDKGDLKECILYPTFIHVAI